MVNPHITEPIVGSTRHIVVADTGGEAEAIARASWPVYNRNFAKRGLDGPGPESSTAGPIKSSPIQRSLSKNAEPRRWRGEKLCVEVAIESEDSITGFPVSLSLYRCAHSFSYSFDPIHR